MSGYELTDDDRSQLHTAAQMTEMMRDHQAHIARLGKKRAAELADLRARGIPVEMMARAMGLARQQVYAILNRTNDTDE